MNESNTISHGHPFKGKRIDGRGNVKYKGQMIVSSYELQFILMKPREKEGSIIDRELFPFKDIKSYGCHENVLSIRLGGPSVGLKEVHFKLKEAVVVRELMDQVTRLNKRPAVRMPSFDTASGFYGMNAASMAREDQQTQRDHQLTALQENPSYMDMNQRNLNSYSRPKMSRSVSTGSSDSYSSLPSPFSGNSGDLTPGHDNLAFQLSPREATSQLSPRDGVFQLSQEEAQAPVQYAVVEISDQAAGTRSGQQAPLPSAEVSRGKKKRGLFKYTSVDIKTMKALEKIKLNE